MQSQWFEVDSQTTVVYKTIIMTMHHYAWCVILYMLQIQMTAQIQTNEHSNCCELSKKTHLKIEIINEHTHGLKVDHQVTEKKTETYPVCDP